MKRAARSVAVLLGVACLLGAGFALAHRHAPLTDPAATCKLTVPHSTIDPMVFPTKGGSEALDAAIVGNADDSTIRRVISEQGGATVPHGTSCTRVEVGGTYDQVLITGGPFDGKLVWVPALHTHGE